MPDAKLPHYILLMAPGPLAPREGVSVNESERASFRIKAETGEASVPFNAALAHTGDKTT